MKFHKLSSRSRFTLVLSMALVFTLLGMASDAHAQDGEPPATPVPEIVGGAPSTPGEWPWQVALIGGAAANSDIYITQFCGGSLIHPQWVLTAAHCITDGSSNVVTPSTVDIVAGIYNLSSPAAGYQRRDVTQIIRHPNYNNFDNDIALLKLSSAITLGGSGETATALIPLVPAGIGDLAARSAWATGWGNTESVPQWPDQLYEVQLPIIQNSVCNDIAHYGGQITANMLCAGYESGGYDTCYGDSGGPLVVFDGGQWKLAGVTSGGEDCAEPSRPGVYARVSQYGNWVNENIGLTTMLSPSGSLGSNYTPTYTWNAVPTMTYYYLWVDGPSGNVLKQWYTAEQAGCGAGTGVCSVIPTTPVGGGNHKWWVQTWNPAGYGPWTSPMEFSTSIPTPPGKASLGSPQGDITNSNPTYTWNEVSGSTWYYLWVNGPSGNIFKQWYNSAQANCNGTTCSIAGATPDLGAGTYTWWIQTYNAAGDGPWSDARSFTVTPPGLPGKATLLSPTGSTADSMPTYTWNEVGGATWYYLWVDGPSGNVIKQWYTSAQANCNGSTCSVMPSTTLSGGPHTWWIQTYNAAGYGPWSNAMSFTTPIPWPEQPTLISPNGSATDLTPTYTWNAVSSTSGSPATWYYLWVDGPSGNVLKQWYTAAEAGCSSGSGTCSITPTTTLLPPGTYKWWVRGYNSAGDGPWSDAMNFTLTSAGGFTEHFLGGYDSGWNVQGGAWTIDGAFFSTEGIHYYSNSASYITPYANFDVSAKMYRSGCDWCDNFLYVRGTPAPLNNYGYWNNGYQFVYANDGYFGVWKAVNGGWTLLQDYTWTSAIIPYDWNTLRVVGSDNNLYFYINGTLVWSGVDYSFTSGLVGVGMDKFEVSPPAGERLWVDWVTLSSYAEELPVITDVVSPEQQALNDTANASGSDKVNSGDHR